MKEGEHESLLDFTASYQGDRIALLLFAIEYYSPIISLGFIYLLKFHQTALELQRKSYKKRKNNRAKY